jgi:hypothetical protein
MSDGFCHYILDSGEISIPFLKETRGVTLLVLSIVNFVAAITLIIVIKINNYRAVKGVSAAAQSVIFPVYVNVLWVNVLVKLLGGCVTFLWPYTFVDNDEASFASAIMFAVAHAFSEGIAYLFTRRGLGWYACKKSISTVFLWFVITLIAYTIIFTFRADIVSFFLAIAWNVVALIFYSGLLFLPKTIVYRRPALQRYSQFMWICHVINIGVILSALYSIGLQECNFIFLVLYRDALFQPFVLYNLLLQDSRWWQGLSGGEGQCA